MALESHDFSDMYRNGVRVVTFAEIKQYESYLRGLYLHSCGHVNEAFEMYSKSLIESGMVTANSLRQSTLENM